MKIHCSDGYRYKTENTAFQECEKCSDQFCKICTNDKNLCLECLEGTENDARYLQEAKCEV